MILVTGLDAFGSQTTNASWEIVSRLPDEVEGVKLLKLKVPVLYYKSIREIIKTVKLNPGITDILLVGQAGGRSRIGIEMIGVNFDDASYPDNAGVIRTGTRIDPDGPDAYFATMPVLDLAHYMIEEKHFPVIVSWSAGQFVCNHIMYGVSHSLRENKLNIRTGFIHVPFTMEQAAVEGVAGLPLDSMIDALNDIVLYIVNYKYN